MLKTHYKKVLETENREEAEKLYKEAVAVIDKGASKGIIHSNNASRKKAALTKHLNKLTESKEKK
jgi:small subunit ribosomal protein S20